MQERGSVPELCGPARSRLEKSLSAPRTIEILGNRRSGKSVAAAELIRRNMHLRPVLVLTKGLAPEIAALEVKKCTDAKKLVPMLENIVQEDIPKGTLLLVVDTLSTLLFAPEDVLVREKAFAIFRGMNQRGVRVLVVNSTVLSPRRTSDFYCESILFRRDPR